MGMGSEATKGKVQDIVPQSTNKTEERTVKKNYEALVKEEIREGWESIQNDYKRKMCKTDAPNISAMIKSLSFGSSRRKENGEYFYIGGVDISFVKHSDVDACACLSVVRMPDLELVYQKLQMVKLTQPYIPGFLAFREVDHLVDLYRDLKSKTPQYLPEVIMVDGNGLLHPRGFGLACQLGVELGVPTMGVAKSLISAQGITQDLNHNNKKKTLSGAGDSFDLVADSGEVLGKCLQVHDKASNPVYVSIGHMISLDSAVWLTLECSKYRIPEPVRMADLESREYIRQEKTQPQEFVKDI